MYNRAESGYLLCHEDERSFSIQLFGACLAWKRDLFEEKLVNRRVPLENLFEEYDGGFDYDNGIKFLMKVFAARNQKQDRFVYTHVTCATDSNTMMKVFLSVQDIVLNNVMIDGGFL